MKTALISVSDKTGIVPFAQGLTQHGYQIVSTGGTYRKLAEAGVSPLVTVEELTGFPEGMNGRIKTLTPQIFGGLLANRSNAEHMGFLTENNLSTIDMVVVNLYPFRAAYENDELSFLQRVEQIDIGGPSMIRAAAKNWQDVDVLVDPADYETVLGEIAKGGKTATETKKKLAAKVFAMTAHYDLLIAKFWAEESGQALRYGENPHQTAVAIENPFETGANLLSAEFLNGKALSYNNYADGTAALELALAYNTKTPFATVYKHATPCGAAVGETIEDAFAKALACDPVSAFGGIIALNQTATKAVAEHIISFFNEVVIAPDYTSEALEVLRTKKNLRVMRIADWAHTPTWALKSIRGGTLMQDADTHIVAENALTQTTKKAPTEAEKNDMVVGWNMVKAVKSNAIIVIKDGAMVGKGGGQTSRVDAMVHALGQAGEKAKGAVVVSDAFFPFPDCVTLAAEAGISAIVQAGGSKNDQASIDVADEKDIAMMTTRIRSFLH